MVEMKYKDILDRLRRNPKCPLEFIEQVIKEDPAHLENLTSDIAIKADKLARDVSREAYKIRAFTRFNLSRHGILFATIEPQYHVEDLVVKWFWRRFPQFVIALESKPKRGVFLFGPVFTDVIFTKAPLIEVIEDLEQRLPIKPVLEEVTEFSEKIWQRYYASQYIPSRKNLKLFLKFLPRKYQKWKGLVTEARFGTRSLDEFTTASQRSNDRSK